LLIALHDAIVARLAADAASFLVNKR
jgi:hypothetical protein